MSSITFVVPGVAVGKARPRATPLMRNGKPVIGKGGRPVIINYTPDKSVTYEGLVAHTARIAMGDQAPLIEALELRLDISVLVPQSWSEKRKRAALAGEIFPTTRPDVDNVEKSIGDGCNGIVWRDDVQVCNVLKRKRYGVRAEVKVEIRSLVDEQPKQRELIDEPEHVAAQSENPMFNDVPF